jgi:hypothetical protein
VLLKSILYFFLILFDMNSLKVKKFVR